MTAICMSCVVQFFNDQMDICIAEEKKTSYFKKSVQPRTSLHFPSYVRLH